MRGACGILDLLPLKEKILSLTLMLTLTYCTPGAILKAIVFRTFFGMSSNGPFFTKTKKKKKDYFVHSEPTEEFALRVYTKDLKSKRKKFVTGA